ncbi:MAG: glutamate racemase [Clostridia bacterium]|nr:glutamate racemase [Clostridia bacterium]
MQIPTGGIAFFDSGIGGLTVLATAKKLLPNQTFYYYGDNGRAPYGNLSPATIMQYTTEAFEVFRLLKVKAAVLACNTATAVCAETLRRAYDFPIIGAEPAVFPAAARGGEILVLSTRATFESERFSRLCARARIHYPFARITATPCDALAGIIEKNLTNDTLDFTPYLPPTNKPLNAVVLGCTHYIYIKEKVAAYYGCETVDGNIGIANRLRFLLTVDHFDGKSQKNRDGQPLVTSSPFFALEKDFCSIVTDGFSAPIFFLGAQNSRNKSIYEQMFAIPCK